MLTVYKTKLQDVSVTELQAIIDRQIKLAMRATKTK